MNFEHLKLQLEQIIGNWDGDLPGLGEERASIAQDVLDKIKEIEVSLKFLNI